MHPGAWQARHPPPTLPKPSCGLGQWTQSAIRGHPQETPHTTRSTSGWKKAFTGIGGTKEVGVYGEGPFGSTILTPPPTNSCPSLSLGGRGKRGANHFQQSWGSQAGSRGDRKVLNHRCPVPCEDRDVARSLALCPSISPHGTSLLWGGGL